MSAIRASYHRFHALLLVIMLVASEGITQIAHAAAPRYFPETQHTLADPLLAYWNAHGGLPVFGYPVSEAFQERNADHEQAYLTQYVERNRFEVHTENRAPYHVLLGRLGDEVLRQHGRNWRDFPTAAPNADHQFAETGHAIAHVPFWRYWSSHGLEFDGKRGFSEAESLALFGLPLSGPQFETNSSGDHVLTQWFERARFEDHGSQGVLLGLLGNEITAWRRGEAPFQPVVAAQPTTPAAPKPTSLHDHARHLFDLTNQRRTTQFGKAAFSYREDLQEISDRIAREYTDLKQQGGDVRALLEGYNHQFDAAAQNAGVIYALVDAPLEAGCKGINPNDPLASAVSPYVAGYAARTLTVGVHGQYHGVCGRAITVIYIIGY